MNFYKTTTELKTEARGLILGKYGIYIATLALMELIIVGLTSIISLILPANYIWSNILDLAFTFIIDLIGAVFSLGLIRFTLNICRNQPYKIGDILYGFSSHPDKAIVTRFLFGVAELVCFLPAILFGILYFITEKNLIMLATAAFLAIGIVLVVTLHVNFDFIYYIMLDYPNATLRECFDYCKEIMNGHRIRFFYLRMSFIPLYLLSILSLCIGFLFVLPYENVTIAKFYLDVFHPEQAEDEINQDKSVDMTEEVDKANVNIEVTE